MTRPPLWASFVAYAEAFGCHPQDVEDKVTLLWWHRWQALEQARSSRRAWEHYNAVIARGGNAVTELSTSEHRAKNWAFDLGSEEE